MKNPGTAFVQLLCTCVFVSTASAQLLLTEDFDHPAGDSLKMHDWTMTGSPSSYSYINPLSVTAPGLEYPGYRGSGVGNAASLAATGQDVSRLLSQPAKEGAVYTFLMVRVSAARTTGDYFLHLIGGAATSSIFAPKLSVKSGDGHIAFGVSKRANANAAAYTPFDYDTATTYVVVLKYRFIPTATTDDEVSLFVFGQSGFPGSEPSTPSVGPVVEASGADVDSLCLIGLRQGSSSSAPALVVDGIRVGVTWESALPIQLSSFQGMLEDAATITLTWVTQSEIDNYGFEVQRSAGLTDPFVTISGLVPGHNTTIERQTYSYTDHAVPPGRWYYRLKSIAMDQSVSYSDAIEVSNVTGIEQKDELPFAFALLPNYPNPFNPLTVIKYTIGGSGVPGPGAGKTRLAVYDMLGRQVRMLVDEVKSPGTYEVSFDGSGLSSGLYICRMAASSFAQSRTMILIR